MRSNKIQFLGIGAARAGSSWLWKQLRRHDDIWMPSVKELHFFDRDPSYPSPSYLSPDSIFWRFVGQERRHQQFRKRVLKEVVKDVIWFRPLNLRWTYRYFFKPCSVDWYKSLFEPGGSRIKGEITPAYSILTRDDIYEIFNICSDIKIIFLIRNPIGRAWSHVRYDYTKGKLRNVNNVEVVKELVDQPVQELRSNYLRTYRNWVSVFGEDKIHIDFYDRVKEDPKGLLYDIGSFLGVSSPYDIYKRVKSGRRVNESQASNIPENVRLYLAKKYINDINKMVDVFGSYTLRWQDEARMIINRGLA